MMDMLFPDSVVMVTSEDAAGEVQGLLPEELSQIHRAADNRKREYAAGRHCARAALRRLGIHGFALVNDADRVPIWPDEVVGSVTHCADFCGVAVAKRHPILGIGFDAEPVRAVNKRTRGEICSPDERKAIEREPSDTRDGLVTAIFSAKESFFKAVFPLFRSPLSFQDVVIEMNDGGTFYPRVLVRLPSGFERLEVAGRMISTASHVLTGVTLSE